LIENQLNNIVQQFEALMNTGIPDEMRGYVGMMGFVFVINVHGEIIDLQQPGSAPPPGEEE
jgi:hypothetical protein